MRALIPESPRFRYFEPFSLRIKEWVVREAINLSLARRRPDLSLGGVIASSASSFCADPRGCLIELRRIFPPPAWAQKEDPSESMMTSLDSLVDRRGGHYYADRYRLEEGVSAAETSRSSSRFAT